MQTAVQTVAGQTNGVIDPRVVLAIIMQESSGRANVTSTQGVVTNPGLMQTNDGSSCDVPVCGATLIQQMIEDGVNGTSSGSGLVQYVMHDGGNLWEGIRAYNSGPLAVTSDLSNPVYNGAISGTPSYCSDVANRLMGVKINNAGPGL